MLSLNTQLRLIQSQLQELSCLDDSKMLSRVFQKLAKGHLSEEQNGWLFANEKFLHLLKKMSNDRELLECIKITNCKVSIPFYIPSFLRKTLEVMLDEDNAVECPDELDGVDQAISVFRKIVSRQRVPDNFSRTLRSSIAQNEELEQEFALAGALHYWDENGKYFSEPWDCDTIEKAYNQMIEWKEKTERQDNVEQTPITLTREEEENFSEGEERKKSLNPQELSLPSNSIWNQLIGNLEDYIDQKNLLKVYAILHEPRLQSIPENGYIGRLIPYFIQRIKMWGIHILDPAHIANLINLSSDSKNNTRPKKLNFGKKIKDDESKLQENKSLSSKPLSRTDIVTSLAAVTSPIVFQDILRLMSLFPIALPLVVQDITTEERKFKCLLPFFQSCSVKWEASAEEICHNRLFASPFRMIAAIRVGTAGQGSAGKSTIVNQIMARKHFFSTYAEPGAALGKSLTLDGSVEIAVLTQETSSSSLWNSVLKHHYSSGSNSVLILANVHGDALQHTETMDLLKAMNSYFLVFFMPCSKEQLEERHERIEELLRTNDEDEERICHMLVDPHPECRDLLPDYCISTNQLALDSTDKVLRDVVQEAIHCINKQPTCDVSKLWLRKSYDSLVWAPDTCTEESKVMLEYIKRHGPKSIRFMLQLQKIDPRKDAAFRSLCNIWYRAEDLQKLIGHFNRILQLPIDQRLIALAHVDREVSLLSAEETAQVRNRLSQLQEQKRRTLQLQARSETQSSEEARLIKQIRLTYEELDEMSLGMEHFYRELGRIYQFNNSIKDSRNLDKEILSLPKRYGELLTYGNAIEILDGDIGDMCGPWCNSICHSVCEIHPDLRVFVVSIIGLQSSGKSTLLNALFACKFAVSVGRCTRGLFMRLLYLDESLSKELGVDAILLIDTEGLGAPEKLNDPLAEQKDRMLATFAMSVSNLTLINVLGESLRDLTDILQIVIVTMARLEKAEISPDILMVQHLSERDSGKTKQGLDEFCKALEEAVNLTEKKDMAIGVRNCKSLQKLESRIRQGEVRKLFRPFKDGASANAPPSREYHEDIVNLYKTILDSCKQMHNPQKFHDWHEIMQSYWNAVSSEDFALRFRNIQEVHEFIDRGNKIAKVKEAINEAFRDHKEEFEVQLRTRLNELINDSSGSSVKNNWKNEKTAQINFMKDYLKLIPQECTKSCPKCQEAVQLKDRLYKDVEDKNSNLETITTISQYVKKTRESVANHLIQTADALMVKHGHFQEFDVIIESILMEKLRIKSSYSAEEREEMVNEIWANVKQSVSEMRKVLPVSRRIINELRDNYDTTSDICKRVIIEEMPDLKSDKAIKRRVLSNLRLDFKQARYLEGQLEELQCEILKLYKEDQFHDGMIGTLKEKINESLEAFEKKEDIKLLPDFKWTAHVYAILYFKNAMVKTEEQWKKNNDPMSILIRNEEAYKKKISIRLEHGFGFEGEGSVVGELLLQAVRQRGQKSADWEHLNFVRGHVWLVCSENVRLEYFSELAAEVEDNKPSAAIAHFSNPKYNMERWFKSQVDSLSKDKATKEFVETFKKEFGKVTQDIRNQVDCAGIKSFVTQYLNQVEDIAYNPAVNYEDKDGFNILQSAILKRLEEGKGPAMSDVTVANPSELDEVKKLLGCTEHCGWCGSLCWGQKGHDENSDVTRLHHACHQPQGLIGVEHTHEKYLISDSCHEVGDDWTFYWSSCRGGMKWRDVKRNSDFNGWTFSSHAKSEFNDLMKWFFLKLHARMASERCCEPARGSDLKHKGFNGLHNGLQKILADIRGHIYNAT